MLSQCPKSSRSAFVLRHGAVRGLSIIELMVGVAIGLAVVAGGAKLLADGLVGNRRTMVEATISQDLRAATDVIARDLRRAGYWQNSHLGVTGIPALNNYRAVTPAPSAGTVATVEYSYSNDGNNTRDDAEFFGFDRATDANGMGFLRMKLGQAGGAGGTPNWQPLTDPRSVNVTGFTVRAVTREISLGEMCRGSPLSAGGTPPSACCRPHPANATQCKQTFFERDYLGYSPTTGTAAPAGTVVQANCPELIVRRFDIVVTGEGLPPNQGIRREIHESVRVRNDEVTQVTCP
jgi:prepilin peptidase dependent protein B